MTIIFYQPTISKMIKIKQSLINKILWQGGCYEVITAPQLTWPMPTQINDWLKENAKSKIYVTPRVGVFVIEFKTVEEAMAFKLTWLEE